MVPSLKPVSVPLPEFSVSTRLLMGSTAMAPKMVSVGTGLVEVQLISTPAPVKQARPLWPVVTMAGRCEREGSSSETSLVLGLKETAVFVKGWKATSAAPSSGAPVLAGPVSSEKSDIALTVWLFGSMKEIWLNVALGSASTALRVIRSEEHTSE